jgi:hypothetical protein
VAGGGDDEQVGHLALRAQSIEDVVVQELGCDLVKRQWAGITEEIRGRYNTSVPMWSSISRGKNAPVGPISYSNTMQLRVAVEEGMHVM